LTPPDDRDAFAPLDARDRGRVDSETKDPIVRYSERLGENRPNHTAMGNGDDRLPVVGRSKLCDRVDDPRMEIAIPLAAGKANGRRLSHPLFVQAPRSGDPRKTSELVHVQPLLDEIREIIEHDVQRSRGSPPEQRFDQLRLLEGPVDADPESGLVHKAAST
jgi:hypothetical protein